MTFASLCSRCQTRWRRLARHHNPTPDRALRLLTLAGLVGFSLFSALAVLAAPQKGAKTSRPWLGRAAFVSYSTNSPLKVFQLAYDQMTSARVGADGTYQAFLADGSLLRYNLDPGLQQAAYNAMVTYRTPYAVFAAVEPKTGRVLALAAHSEHDPTWIRTAPGRVFNMASLFKMVTCAAALEKGVITADSSVAFNGGYTSESPAGWQVTAKRPGRLIPVADAMGKSVNPVFGRMAADLVGAGTLRDFQARFGFNDQLFPGTFVTPSPAPLDASTAALMRTGAGLNHGLRISPLHALALIEALATDGTLRLPQLAASITAANGKLLFDGTTPHPLRQAVQPATAQAFDKLLATTVSTGTSRKAFRASRGRHHLADITIAAKTGSINGTDPQGHYTWFAAYAPIADPEIALVALVINGDRWHIKASNLGALMLEEFFD